MTLLLAPGGDTARNTAQAVNQALKGKLNCVGTLTLAAGAASTLVANALVGPQSVLVLMPQTAHAAAEIGAGTIWIAPGSIVSGESFTVSHANNAQTDRVFGYVILG